MHIIDSFTGSNRFLSNFFAHRIEFGDIWYPTNEHAFHAQKTHDQDLRREIARAKIPLDAKRMGRRLTLRDDWNEVSFRVMFLLNQAKFRDGVLRMALMTTGESLLVEGNIWHDNLWGDCRCGRPQCDVDGRNQLGQILMEIRSDLFLEYT